MLLGGLTKALKSKDQLRESGMGWVEPWPPAALRAIGCAEVLGAVGVILPGLLGIAPILVPIAAVCLAVTMVGAVIVHAVRKEFAGLGMPLVLLTLAVIVAVGRFSIAPF